MRFNPFVLPAFVLFLLVLAIPSLAQTAETITLDANPHSKSEHFYVDYKVNDDGAVETTVSMATTILKEDVVKYLKQGYVTYSTSAEKADITEAYTRKPDGKRIDAPKDNFQLSIDKGRDKDAPAFSDHTTMTVIFPDVAEGDTVVLSYKVTQTEPIFPKQFSFMRNFGKTYTWDDVKVKIDMPLSLKAQYANFGMTEKTNKEENGRKIIELTYENKQPIRDKETYAAVFDPEKEPGYAVSNFPSYAAISQAYGERAKPKAAVTDHVKKLAEDITKGKTAPREQAKALYDWVSKNISYAGNCIGIGAVVPRDLDFVINNKMGDCKDHATLLQALLAAKGIDSTQALINVGAIYHLPKIPVVATVNHVINYIPSLNLFADATAHAIPFGLLPGAISGKPVLLVDGFKEGLTTPPLSRDMMRSKTDTKLKIGEDGSAQGTVTVDLRGNYAAEAADGFKKLDKDPQRKKEFLDKMVKGYGFDGTLDLKGGSFDDTNYAYQYVFAFNLKQFLKVGAPGALYVIPQFADSVIASIIARTHEGEDITKEFVCSGGSLEEAYTYEFPKNVNVLAVPDGVMAANSVQHYKSTYHLDGHTVTASRTLEDLTPGPTCAPEIDKQYKEIAEKAFPDLKSQVVYK